MFPTLPGLSAENHSFQGQNPVTSCTFPREDAQGDSDPLLLSDMRVPPSPLQGWHQVKWATLAQLHPLFPQCERSSNRLLIGLTSASHLWLLRAFFVYNLCHNLSRLSFPVCLSFLLSIFTLPEPVYFKDWAANGLWSYKGIDEFQSPSSQSNITQDSRIHRDLSVNPSFISFLLSHIT